MHKLPKASDSRKPTKYKLEHRPDACWDWAREVAAESPAPPSPSH